MDEYVIHQTHRHTHNHMHLTDWPNSDVNKCLNMYFSICFNHCFPSYRLHSRPHLVLCNIQPGYHWELWCDAGKRRVWRLVYCPATSYMPMLTTAKKRRILIRCFNISVNNCHNDTSTIYFCSVTAVFK